MTIIDGKALAQEIRNDLKLEVQELKEKGINPKLAVIMVGEDKASAVYVRNKSKACNELGIEFEEFIKGNETTQKELIDLIDELNKREDIHGILLQSPIPKNLDIREAFNRIDSKKDVDGFNPINVGKLAIGEDCFISCTPYGVIKMLEAYNIEIEGKRAVVIGRSNIVGKPVAQCLLNKNATVTICHSKTRNIAEVVREADIVIADLPCSGLGVIGNKVDIKYNTSIEQINELAKLQKEILSVVSKYVKPGGTLIYSTCTVTKEENEDNVKWIEENLPFKLQSLNKKLPEQIIDNKHDYVQILPGKYGMDGFFISAFRRIDK